MRVSILLTTLLASMTSYAIDNPRALKMALDDEYKAFATYQQVLDDFGNVRPFTNIARAEQRHINALLPFFEKYDLEVPANEYLGQMESYPSVQAACQAGVDAEIANVELYDKIYSLTDDEELIAVFENLQAASQDKHLPAFQRCARRK
ncbi:MAG: DUF2202 domain-containing protein [Bdellovibrionales bacterium]|nr:DUF2202 domain-containing protein [Bdellovibrionales bacterium]